MLLYLWGFSKSDKGNSFKLDKLVLLFFLISAVFFGQDKEIQYYDWYDNIQGKEHTGIYNGTYFFDVDYYRIHKNSHPYFRSSSTLKGTVVYDGQTYYNVNMKYDTHKDLLLVFIKPTNDFSVLALIPNKIEDFTIDGTRFIRKDTTVNSKILDVNFCEVLLESDSYSLLKTHKKKKKELLEDDIMYLKFEKVSNYVLYKNQQYTIISSKRDLIEAFPSLKKDIKKFYLQYKIMKETQPDEFMKRLLNMIKRISSSKIAI